MSHSNLLQCQCRLPFSSYCHGNKAYGKKPSIPTLESLTEVSPTGQGLVILKCCGLQLWGMGGGGRREGEREEKKKKEERNKKVKKKNKNPCQYSSTWY